MCGMKADVIWGGGGGGGRKCRRKNPSTCQCLFAVGKPHNSSQIFCDKASKGSVIPLSVRAKYFLCPPPPAHVKDKQQERKKGQKSTHLQKQSAKLGTGPESLKQSVSETTINLLYVIIPSEDGACVH